eukprot:s3379_g7.t1
MCNWVLCGAPATQRLVRMCEAFARNQSSQVFSTQDDLAYICHLFGGNANSRPLDCQQVDENITPFCEISTMKLPSKRGLVACPLHKNHAAMPNVRAVGSGAKVEELPLLNAPELLQSETPEATKGEEAFAEDFETPPSSCGSSPALRS